MGTESLGYDVFPIYSLCNYIQVPSRWWLVNGLSELLASQKLFDQTWVGFENFKVLFEDPVFFQVLRNTIAISAIKLTLGMFLLFYWL